jgi:hypothetical protein
MADQALKIWANTINIDSLTNAPQRREISDEEFQDGWLRNANISAQQLNSMFFLLSLYSNPFASAPVLYPDSLAIPDEALELNGQSITEATYPNAYSIYGASLPDLTGDAPTGFTYIIRAS